MNARKPTKDLRTKYVFLIASIALSSQIAGHAQSTDCQSCNMDERIRQATELKSGFEEFIDEAKSFHKQAQKQILEAQKLQGEAQKLEGSAQFQLGTTGTLHPQIAKLSATQLKAAAQQYSGDLSKFIAHAEQYNAHATQFDQQLGRCKASEDLYKANLQKYELHLQEFHLPDITLPSQAMAMGVIKPPHICPAMLAKHGEAQSMVNQYYNDQVRLLSAEQQLNNAETGLQAARQKAGLSDAELQKEIVRGQREQTLALEFGRLKDEYDMLLTEKDRIASSSKGGGNVTSAQTSSKAQTNVQGKVQPK